MAKRRPSQVGNYHFTGKMLGKGNFAKVDEANHSIIGVKVAVKVMDINSIKEEYVIRNLFREAKIMSKLKHPCIVSLFEAMQRPDNTYYLITEFVSGGDLCSYIKGQRNGKLEESGARLFAQQFVSALSYMHQRGIVHRDLKMENVMLNSLQNQIKIVDFGLSNVWSPDNPLKTHCGSPEYAAPELFVTSKVYGPEVDLWSLGIILYGMVVGRLPFVSNKAENISSQERRRLLVDQINKGISFPQRKAISGRTQDFRNMLGRLLQAEATKRITIKDLSAHPWITENGKKYVRTNPIPKVSSDYKAQIVREISTLTNLPEHTLIDSIRQDPYGKIGGMFNIVLYQNTIEPFNIKSIIRDMPTAVTAHPPKFHENRAVSAPTGTRIVKTPGRPHTPFTISVSPKQKANVETQTRSSQNRPLTPNKREGLPIRRPQTSRDSRPKEEEAKPSCLSKRQAYANNIRPKTWQANSQKKNEPKKEKKEEKEAVKEKKISIFEKSSNRNNNYYQVIQTKSNELCVIGKRGVTDALFLKRLESKPTAVDAQTVCIKKIYTPSRPQTEIAKVRSKSEPTSTVKRPMTHREVQTSASNKQTPRKMINPRLGQSNGRNETAKKVHSASKTTYTTISTSQSKAQQTKKQPPVEQHAQARGDGCMVQPKISAKPVQNPSPHKKMQIRDGPIAKSIADYVGKNVLHALKHFKT